VTARAGVRIGPPDLVAGQLHRAVADTVYPKSIADGNLMCIRCSGHVVSFFSNTSQLGSPDCAETNPTRECTILPKWASMMYNDQMSELATLRDVIRRHASNYHGPSGLDGLTITATDLPTAPRPGVSEPSLAMVVQGRKQTIAGGEIFDYAAGEYLLISLEVPVIGKVTEATAALPFVGLGVRLDAAEIASLVLDSTTVRRGGDWGSCGNPKGDCRFEPRGCSQPTRRAPRYAGRRRHPRPASIGESYCGVS